jgi:hypothetical protein
MKTTIEYYAKASELGVGPKIKVDNQKILMKGHVSISDAVKNGMISAKETEA